MKHDAGRGKLANTEDRPVRPRRGEEPLPHSVQQRPVDVTREIRDYLHDVGQGSAGRFDSVLEIGKGKLDLLLELAGFEAPVGPHRHLRGDEQGATTNRPRNRPDFRQPGRDDGHRRGTLPPAPPARSTLTMTSPNVSG